MWPVPTWNLRHRCASRYEQQASCRKSYRRLSVWGEPGWPLNGRSISSQRGMGEFQTSFLMTTAYACISNACRFIFLAKRSDSPNGSLSLSVAIANPRQLVGQRTPPCCGSFCPAHPEPSGAPHTLPARRYPPPWTHAALSWRRV